MNDKTPKNNLVQPVINALCQYCIKSLPQNLSEYVPSLAKYCIYDNQFTGSILNNVYSENIYTSDNDRCSNYSKCN